MINKKIIYFLLLFTPIMLSAQSVNQQKFRLAKSYEESGDMESAERLYREVTEAVPQNIEFFKTYADLMKSLDKYKELLKISSDRVQLYDNPYIYNLTAELNWREGKTDIADEFWQSGLEKFGESPETYSLFASTQLNLQLYGKAANTLLEGRDELGSENAFSNALSRIYVAMNNYKKGTEEVLTLLNSTRDIALAQGRLYAFMTTDEATSYIDEALGDEVEKQPSNILLLELYSWFLNTTGRHDKALDIVIKLDNKKKSNGRDILTFGNNARQAGHFNTALEAFSEIIKRGRENPYTPSAMYGLTRTQEFIILDKGSISDEDLNDLIDSYYKIIDEYPRSSNAAESYFRIATVYSDMLGKYDKAISMLDELNEKFPNSATNHKGLNLSGEIRIKQGKLDEARKIFTSIVEGRRKIQDEIKREALFMAAEIEFMKGNIDSSLSMYQILTNYPESNAANDALSRMYTINQNSQYQKALRIFANAELLNFQNKKDEAKKQYLEAASTASGTSLAELSYIAVADINFENNDEINARKYYTIIVDEFPNSVHIDYCILQIANSYFREGKFVEAKQFYNEILVKYPNSIYLDKARKKIREIRNDES